jgi:hypothetical protein
LVKFEIAQNPAAVEDRLRRAADQLKKAACGWNSDDSAEL